MNLADTEPAWPIQEAEGRILGLTNKVHELEETLIPHGLHVVGKPASDERRTDLLTFAAKLLMAKLRRNRRSKLSQTA